MSFDTYSSLGLFILLLLVELRHVQGFVNVPWDWSDFSAQLLLNSVEGESVVVGDQVDGDTKVAEPATSADPVQVGLGHLREVEVDDNVDGLDVDTPGEQVAADEVATETGSEVVEDPVTVSLGHLGMDVVTGVAKLCDLLGEQLNPLGGVAENDTLIDLQLGK